MLCLALPAQARPDVQMAQAETAQEAVSQPEPAAAPLLMPPVFYLAPKAEDDFLTERRAAMDAFSRATVEGGTGDPGTVRALLDLAEMHFAHGFAAEGLSLLEPLDIEKLSPAHASRLAALQLALGLIDTRNHPLTEPAARLLTADYAGWPDQPLFLSLARIREGVPEQAVPYLAGAVDRLTRFPAPVREAVLPDLLDLAVTAADWRTARDLAAEFPGHGGLKGSPAYHYQLGRAAEAGADELAALNSYARAGLGGDLWAHKARLAVVAMGLHSGMLERSEARTIMEQEQHLWIGDVEARKSLILLSKLQIADRDRIAALETLGTLTTRYPGTDEANAARETARDLIIAVYEEGASGKMTLSQFLEAHRRIAPDFRYDPAYALQCERFADTFRAAGATKVASDEYGEIHDYLAVIHDLGIEEIPGDRLDRLRLKQAETLLDGGRYDEAATALTGSLQSEDAELRDRRNVLLARLYSETGADADVVQTEVFVPSESYLRTKAAAYFDLGDWAGAEQAYDQLFSLYGPELAFADAINLVLSAFRNGNAEKAVALAQNFPDFENQPEWAELAASLNDDAPQLLPLRRDTAQERIDQASETLDRLNPAAPSN